MLLGLQTNPTCNFKKIQILLKRHNYLVNSNVTYCQKNAIFTSWCVSGVKAKDSSDLEPLRQSLKSQHKISINKIYGSVSDQKEAIVIFEQIDDQRKLMNINILPGGFVARTPA